jgi:catechol 2,3-dioxygenase-like lactoylglutathione lyase family enzyme
MTAQAQYAQRGPTRWSLPIKLASREWQTPSPHVVRDALAPRCGGADEPLAEGAFSLLQCSFMAKQPSLPSFQLAGVNIDCANALAMAGFYGRLLGWEVTYRDNDFISMRDPAGGAGLSFQEETWYQPPVWPEQPGELTKMIHLDIKVDDLDAAVADALAAGARLAEHQPRLDLRIMLDPAGHPFCLCLE